MLSSDLDSNLKINYQNFQIFAKSKLSSSTPSGCKKSIAESKTYIESQLISYSFGLNWFQPKRITGCRDICIPVTKFIKLVARGKPSTKLPREGLLSRCCTSTVIRVHQGYPMGGRGQTYLIIFVTEIQNSWHPVIRFG